ncbi:MAG: dockerin type I domain-containing protein [Planctomycetota bacterium]
MYTVDFNADGNINLADLSFLAKHWGSRNCTQPNCCDGTDVNNDGSVDHFDLARLLQYWLRIQ